MKKILAVALVGLALSGNVNAALSSAQVVEAAQMLSAFGNCSRVMQVAGDEITSEYLLNKAVEISMKVEDNATPRQQKEILSMLEEYTENFYTLPPEQALVLCDNLANGVQ